MPGSAHTLGSWAMASLPASFSPLVNLATTPGSLLTRTTHFSILGRHELTLFRYGLAARARCLTVTCLPARVYLQEPIRDWPLEKWLVAQQDARAARHLCTHEMSAHYLKLRPWARMKAIFCRWHPSRSTSEAVRLMGGVQVLAFGTWRTEARAASSSPRSTCAALLRLLPFGAPAIIIGYRIHDGSMTAACDSVFTCLITRTNRDLRVVRDPIHAEHRKGGWLARLLRRAARRRRYRNEPCLLRQHSTLVKVAEHCHPLLSLSKTTSVCAGGDSGD